MLSATQVAELAGCSRFTVERACNNKELESEKVGRNWVIEEASGRQWARQYRPHARTGRAAGAEKPDAGTVPAAADPPGASSRGRSRGSGPADGPAGEAG